MFKIYTHNLIGTNKKKIYKCWVCKLYRIKIEIIAYGKKKLYRIEWNDWNE